MSENKNPDYRKTVLLIVNGWGLSDDKDLNPFKKAKTPGIDTIFKDFPHERGLSSGMAAGLPNGQAGNSEVGHLNIGAGRVVYQELTKISKTIQTGLFFKNEALLAAVENCRAKDSCLHIIGLLSDGGVHSHERHLYALLDLAKRNSLNKVYVHCILDGVDSGGRSALMYLERLQGAMRVIGTGEIASCMGRYYAMDRSGKYERVKLAYNVLTEGEGEKAANYEEAVQSAYMRRETDEFIKPTVIVNGGVPVGTINDDDSVIFFNFRADRAVELTKAFCDEEFRLFKREKKRDVFFTCFEEYDPEIENKTVAFRQEHIDNNLIEWLDNYDIPSAVITESEGALNMTRFFTGNTFDRYDSSEVFIVNSPKTMSYDVKPDMCCGEITDRIISCLRSEKYALIVADFINIDIMGHIAREDSLIEAIEALDKNLIRISRACDEEDATLFICSDHGNSERMLFDKNIKEPFKQNTTDPVPFILVNYLPDVILRPGGTLADVAPTVLDIMGIKKPREMTGKSLLYRKY